MINFPTKNYLDKELERLERYFQPEIFPNKLTPKMKTQHKITQNEIKSYGMNFETLKCAFIGCHIIKQIPTIKEIVNPGSTTDLLALAIGFGASSDVADPYISFLKNYAREKQTEEKCKNRKLSYLLFITLMEIGYEMLKPKIQKKEKPNHYKEVFKNKDLATNFLNELLKSKIPTNGREMNYVQNPDEFVEIRDPNIDGKDKSLYVKEISKILNEVYSDTAYFCPQMNQ